MIWSQENFALISRIVDFVSINSSTHLNHVLRDTQKVCELAIIVTVLKLIFCLQFNLCLPLQNFKDEDVFVCESRYNVKTKSFKKMKVDFVLLCEHNY